MIEYLGIAHASVLVADTQRALGYYRDVLGLRGLPERPDPGYPGAWLAVGDQQIHLPELPNPRCAGGTSAAGAGMRRSGRSGERRPAHGGRDRNTAIHLREIVTLKAALDRAGISYTLSRSRRAALFCRDPDGNALEFIERRK